MFILNYFQVEYHPDTREVINNGAKISLVHWKMDRFLNSHNVASTTDIRNSEVSGFSNFRKKSKTKVLNEVTCFFELDIDKVGLTVSVQMVLKSRSENYLRAYKHVL